MQSPNTRTFEYQVEILHPEADGAPTSHSTVVVERLDVDESGPPDESPQMKDVGLFDFDDVTDGEPQQETEDDYIFAEVDREYGFSDCELEEESSETRSSTTINNSHLLESS